jgi:hypothetical protein
MANILKLRQGTVEELCSLLEHQCPQTWARITAKRYQLPDYRRPDYANQLDLNREYIRVLWGLLTSFIKPDQQPEERLRQGNYLVNIMLSLAAHRPTYFLKPDHAAALMRTDLPEDLSLSDFHWRHPQIRIMLPQRLLGLVSPNGQQAAFATLDLARTGLAKETRYPRELTQELDRLGNLCRIREEFGVGPVEEDTYFQNQPAIAQILTLEVRPATRPPQYLTYSYNVTASSFKEILEAQRHFDLTLQELVGTNCIHERFAHLGLQCLLYMSRQEEEVPDEIIRPARLKGHHLKSGILRAKFVDEYCRKVQPGQARVVADYHPIAEPTGRHVTGHWRRGHWVRQPYGPKHSLRKLIWIQPCKVAMNDVNPPAVPNTQPSRVANLP